MAEIEPINLIFSPVATPAYFDPAPINLVDFTELFASDVGQFTKYTEGTPGTTSLAGNEFIIDHVGTENDIITENTFAYTMPQSFVQINFDSLAGSPTGYNNMGVGLVKDANNFLFATFWQLTNQVSIQIKIGGSNFFLTTVSKTLTASFKLGLSLVGNSACAWVDTGSGWKFVTGYDVTSKYDFRTTGNLTGWKAGFGLATGGGSSTVKFSNFISGRFGGVGLRDMTIVTNEDGTPYVSGTAVQFTATASDPLGFSGSYCGVWTLDLSDNSIVQNAVLMVSRDGKTYNDVGAHIIWHADGSRRLFITTWGNGFGGVLQVLYGLLISGDILTGTNVVSGLTQLTLPGATAVNYGAYDPMVVYDAANARWLIAYTVTTNTGFSGTFYAALAYSSDLTNFIAIGADTANHNWEGTKILLANGQYWVLVGGPSGLGNSSRVYDAALNYVGSLDVVFSGGADTQPHPMVFSYVDDFYLLTSDNTKYGSNAFTWGQPIIENAPRYPAPPVYALVGSVSIKVNIHGVITFVAAPPVLAKIGSVGITVAPKGVIAFATPLVLSVVGSVRVRVRPTGVISEVGPHIRACIGSVKLKIGTHGVVGGFLPISPSVLSIIGSVRIRIGVPGATASVVPSTLAVIGSVKICIGEFRVPELTVVQLLSPADLTLAVIGSVEVGVGPAGVITLSTPPVYTVPPPQAVQEAFIQIRVAGVIAFIHPQIIEVIGDIEVAIGGGVVDPGVFESYVLTGAKSEPSIYSGFNFNSYAKYRGQYYGAGMDGVYLLEGSDDAGDDIHSGVRIGPWNAGTDREKRLRLLRCGGKTRGAQVKVSNGNGSVGYYDVVWGRAGVSREVQGREITIEITDFETLDHLEILPLILAKR